MAGFKRKIKRILNSCIHQMSLDAKSFSVHPGKDFSRKGKLGFEKTIALLLGMEGKSLNNELLSFFSCAEDTPSASAFVQSRAKLNADALPFLLKSFSSRAPKQHFKGYRLFAADGSSLQIPYNPDHLDSLITYSNGQHPVNLLHLNALYDLCSNTYSDALIEGQNSYNEQRALITMCERNPNRHSIYIADRGYESFNLLAHIQAAKSKFLIRIRNSCGIAQGLQLPDTDEFDCSLTLKIFDKRTENARSSVPEACVFKYVSAQKFDYELLPLDTYGCFTLYVRVLRFKLTDERFETVITNLDPCAFTPVEIKNLYNMRWGIETSFRHLKYAIGLLHFHSKKVEYIHQEIFARLIMYNFCELITSHTITHQKCRNYTYKVNFSTAVHICRQFLRGNISPPVVETQLLRYDLPIRPDRSFPRAPSAKGCVSFNYRIA